MAVAVLSLLLAATWLVVELRSTGAGTAADTVASTSPAPDASGARTALPGLTPATGEPLLAGLATARPAPGEVARLAGPFDDRISWSRLRLTSRGVTGTVTVTSDVSDVLELQVLAGFYDRRGDLLGSRRFEQHSAVHTEATGSHPDEAQEFAVPIPGKWRRATASAAVGVTVLVNE